MFYLVCQVGTYLFYLLHIVFILDRFSAVDSKGGVAPTVFVTVNLCNCSGHGKCLFGERAEGQVGASTFRIVACKCNLGYTGM